MTDRQPNDQPTDEQTWSYGSFTSKKTEENIWQMLVFSFNALGN